MAPAFAYPGAKAGAFAYNKAPGFALFNDVNPMRQSLVPSLTIDYAFADPPPCRRHTFGIVRR
jgi:hypothetical protein